MSLIATYAGGCFWGVEHLFRKLDGIINATSGYMGGKKENPTYEEVCKEIGHYEVVRVEYDPTKTDYEKTTKYFLEIHDPTQADGQGPDIGERYKSVIFYHDEEQKRIAEKLINILKNKGLNIVTSVKKVEKFYPAEEYHQDYFNKNSSVHSCHFYTKRFDD